MSLLDNQNSEFKTQLHENSVLHVTHFFYPGNSERQVLESNRKRQDSNHERQKVKSTNNNNNNNKIKKKKKKKNILFDNHTTTIKPTLLFRIQLEAIPRNKSFPLQTEQQEPKLK